MRKNWRGSSAWAQGQGVVSTSFPIHVRPMAQSRHLDAACGSHRSASLHWIRPCPFSETVRAWPVCGQEGAILQWGMSNPDVAGTEDSLSLPQGKDFAAAQALYDSEERVIGYGLVPWCSRRGIPVMAYVPMGDRRFGNMPPLRGIPLAGSSYPVRCEVQKSHRLCRKCNADGFSCFEAHVNMS